MRKIAAPLTALIAGLAAAAAWAQEAPEAASGASAGLDRNVIEEVDGLPVIGVPRDGWVDFQPPATELARDLQWLDGLVSVIMFGVVLVVLALLATVVIRYNRDRNKTPATFTHNSPVEIAWTLVPILILVFVGAFSLPVLFEQQEIPEGDVTIKVTGYQWYWGYEYVDEGIEFEGFMLAPDELEPAGYGPEHYRLATDTSVVVPTGAVVVMQVTAADVIHSWTIPSFGVKQDAIPGRLAELWFEAEREGVYFGQCSELCGKDHAYMPITVKAVSPEAYREWLVEMGGASVAQAPDAAVPDAAPLDAAATEVAAR